MSIYNDSREMHDKMIQGSDEKKMQRGECEKPKNKLGK
jgi:hypothetical protein